MPLIREDMVEAIQLVPQESIRARIVEQSVDYLVSPQVVGDTVEVVIFVSQERVIGKTSEQIVSCAVSRVWSKWSK